MNLTRLAVRNPVGTLLVMIVVIVLGTLGLMRLPTAYFPRFSVPAAVILTVYPGASALEVEQEITKKVERVIASVEHIDYIRSTSIEGMSQVTIGFDWGTDMIQAADQLQAKLEEIRRDLPRDAEKPTVFTINSFLQASMQLGVTSNRRSLAELREYVEEHLQNRFTRLDEVATVTLSGGTERIVEVRVDRDRLAARGLSLAQVIGALQRNNVTLPGGRLNEPQQEYIVRALGKYQTLDDIRHTMIGQVRNIPVYLEDVADVRFTAEEQRSYSRINGQPSVGISIGTRSDGNVVRMCDAVREELKTLRKTLPSDIQIFVAQDQSLFIKRAIRALARNALTGAVLAAIVVFLFLGNVRNTLVIALAIPLSVVAAFLLMNFFGLTLNVISLGGLALGVGLVVDSAIVVLENIYRHLRDEPAETREETVVGATREVGLAITASTLTTLAVFVPMAFLRGLASVLLGELALTVVFALLASLIVALTVVPMLGYRLIHVRGGATEGRLGQGVRHTYERMLDWCLRHRWGTLGIATLIFIASFGLMRWIDVELLPATDEGQFWVQFEYPVGTPLAITEQSAREVEDYLAQLPGVENVFAIVGQKGVFAEPSPEYAEIMVQLVPQSQRKPIDQIMAQVRRELPPLPGADVKVKVQTLTEHMTGAPVDVRIQGDDLDTLRKLGQQAVAALREIPGLINLTSSLEKGKPEIHLTVDRQKAADLGVSVSDIAMTVRTAVAGTVATRWSHKGREYDIEVRLPEDFRRTTADIGELLIPTRNGNLPLSQLAAIRYGEGPVTIYHTDQMRNVAITADISGRSKRAVMADIKARLGALNLPEGYQIVYKGQSRAIRESFSSLTVALIIAVFLVYVVMGIQFESFVHPFTIMFSLPLAFVGVLLGLWIGGSSLCLNSFLGGIVLAGIVVNNAIVLIDYINRLRQRGLSRREAILQAGPIRLRPILMTALTTISGMLPIALGLGEGAETLAPLGIAVIGGLATSTFLTLLVIPCVYTIFDDLRRKQPEEVEAHATEWTRDMDAAVAGR